MLDNVVRALCRAWLQLGLCIVSYLAQTSWKQSLWCMLLVVQKANHYHAIGLKKFGYIKC